MMENRHGPPYLTSAQLAALKEGGGDPPEYRCEAYSPKTDAKREAKYLAAAKVSNPISAWMLSLQKAQPDHETWLRSHLGYYSAGAEKTIMLQANKFEPTENQLPQENAEYATIKAKEKEKPKQGFPRALWEYGR